jgi:tetratricopeptide (TPR) repeat protein
MGPSVVYGLVRGGVFGLSQEGHRVRRAKLFEAVLCYQAKRLPARKKVLAGGDKRTTMGKAKDENEVRQRKKGEDLKEGDADAPAVAKKDGKKKDKSKPVPAAQSNAGIFAGLFLVAISGAFYFVGTGGSLSGEDKIVCFDQAQTDCMPTSKYMAYKTNWEDAVAFQQEERLEEAMESYGLALETRPGDANCLTNMASMYVDLEEYEKAHEQLLIALAKYPNHASANYNMASVLDSLKRPEEAAKHLRHVIKLDPENTNAKAYLKMLKDAKKVPDVPEDESTGAAESAPVEAEAESDSPELDELLGGDV